MTRRRALISLALSVALAGCIFLDPFGPLGQEPSADDGGLGSGDELVFPDTTTTHDGAAPSCTPGTTRPCYSGPAATRNVGTCTDGVETCLEDGGYSACENEVLPSTERCETTTDESCDHEPACTGAPRRARNLGDGDEQEALGIAADESQLFVAGHYAGAIPLGPGVTLAQSGTATHDGFVIAFDHEAKPKWGASLRDGRFSAIAASASYVAAAGFIEDASEIAGCAPLAHSGQHDAVVALFSKSGACLAARSFGDAEAQDFTAVAIDPTNGDVLVGGHFLGEIDFGDGFTLTQVGPRDGFGVRFDAQLKAKEVFHLKGGSVTVNAVAVSSAGLVAIGGSFVTRIDLDEQWQTALGGYDAFVATPPYLGRFYGGRLADVRALGFDPAGTLVVAGTYTGTLVMGGGGGSYDSAGSHDIYVARYSVPEVGTLATVTTAGGAFRDHLAGLAIDPLGNVIVTGEYTNTAKFGETTLPDAGIGLFAAKYAPDAGLVWSRGYGTPGTITRGAGVATNLLGEIFIAGAFSGEVDFGGDGGLLLAAGPSAMDLLVLKRAP